jgi:hypothetical protein
MRVIVVGKVKKGVCAILVDGQPHNLKVDSTVKVTSGSFLAVFTLRSINKKRALFDMQFDNVTVTNLRRGPGEGFALEVQT